MELKKKRKKRKEKLREVEGKEEYHVEVSNMCRFPA
jgi:hypothetical protein